MENIEKTASELRKCANTLADIFCEKHDYENCGWVGRYIGGTLCCSDEVYASMEEILLDLEKEVEVGEFEKYWDYTFDLAMLECPKTITYEAWLKGAPKPYSQERLDAIRKAHNEVAIAKRVLEDLLND